MLIYLCIDHGCFVLYQQSCSRDCKTSKPKLFTIWPFIDKKSANLQGVGITLEFFDLDFLFDDNKLNNFYHISNISNHLLGQFRIFPVFLKILCYVIF